jgi:hypothetical protein
MSLFESASLVVTPNGTKASKLYAIKPTDGSGDLSVTRATTATRVNSSGLIESVATNVPRLDYTNSSCPSILVEPQRTNLALRSEEFNLIWSQLNATITANVTTAPDGTSTADKLVENATNNQHRIDQTTTSAIGTNTFSVFAKKSERDSIWLRVGTSGAYFDLTNGTVSGATAGVTTLIENYGNGWYKCSIVRTSTVANEIVRINLAIGTNGTYLGDGTSGLFIWGAQLEAGSYPTSYIPTTTASVTRNADVISKTGISSLIGQTEGTIFADFNKTKNNLSILSIDDGTANNRIFIEGTGTSTGLRVRVTNGGTTTVDNTSNVLQNGINKIALVYANNNVSLYRNGVLIFNDNSATIPNTSILRIGSNVTNLFQLDDSVNSAVLWKTALTDQECINLTTL